MITRIERIEKPSNKKLETLVISIFVIPFCIWFLSVWGHTYKRVYNRIYTVTYHIQEVKNDVVVVVYEDGSTSSKSKAAFQSLDKSIRYRENSEADRFTMFLLTVCHLAITFGLVLFVAFLFDPFIYKYSQKPENIVKGAIQ